MEERKEIVIKMVSMGMPTSKALTIAEIPRSTFYYKSNGRKKGKKNPMDGRFTTAKQFLMKW